MLLSGELKLIPSSFFYDEIWFPRDESDSDSCEIESAGDESVVDKKAKESSFSVICTSWNEIVRRILFECPLFRAAFWSFHAS